MISATQVAFYILGVIVGTAFIASITYIAPNFHTQTTRKHTTRKWKG